MRLRRFCVAILVCAMVLIQAAPATAAGNLGEPGVAPSGWWDRAREMVDTILSEVFDQFGWKAERPDSSGFGDEGVVLWQSDGGVCRPGTTEQSCAIDPDG